MAAEPVSPACAGVPSPLRPPGGRDRAGAGAGQEGLTGERRAARPPVETGGTSWQGDVYSRRTLVWRAVVRRTVVRRTGTRAG